MHTSTFTIEFGDCDDIGIVFYPNYFYWLDCTFQRILRERGLSQRELRRQFGAVTPLVDAGARFLAPASYDDVVTAHAWIGLWAAKRFRVDYRFEVAGRPILEAHEERAWAVNREGGGIRGAPIPDAFRALFPA